MRKPARGADAAHPSTMTAWLQRRYGGPETVSPEQVEVPVPGAGEVLLRVRATALNSGDVRLMRGEPLLVRLFFGLRRPTRPGRGMDVAGVVVACGPNVAAFAPGDEVVGELPGGGLAPYVLAPVTRLVARPDAVSAVAASTLPIAGGTAWKALELAGIDAGARVLVIGASGGVGTMTVQLAVERGIQVWALTGARTQSLIDGLGAARTFDYRTVAPEEVPREGDGFDAVIDIAGTAPLRTLQRLVRAGGVVVLVSGHGGRVLGPVGRMLRALVLHRRSAALRPLSATPDTTALRALIEQVATGQLTPVIERTWPLSQAREALAHVDAGHTVGKVVVTAEG